MAASKYFLILVLVINEVPDSMAGSYTVAPCYDDGECEHLENATCVEYICNCNGSNLCTEKPVLVVTKLGEPCRRNLDCNVDYAECKQDACTCKENYIASTDEKRCLLVATGLGGKCEDSPQCWHRVPHSGCQNNKCVCQQQMHEYARLCYNNVELGQNCQYDGDCSNTEFSRCLNGTCTCQPKYVPSTKGSRCLAVAAGENAPCVDDAQCTATLGPFSECKDAFCRCKDLHQVKQSTNQCVRDMVLGEKCMNHSDCHGPNPGPSRLECILGVCKCKSFFKEHQGFCISGASRGLGSYDFKKLGISLAIMVFTWFGMLFCL